MCMLRTYSFLQKARHAGPGHDLGGLAATKLGECIVNCWACPQVGRNIPADWFEVEVRYR
jgi:hypothetical protein